MAGLTSKDYKDAVVVQDACNLSGVVHSFAEVVSRIWEEAHEKGKGTDWVNKHPICMLFADKILSLAGGNGDENFRKAYAACLARS